MIIIQMSFADSTTSSHMGAKPRAFMIYPSHVRAKDMAGFVHDLGIVFVSLDLIHDKHQVIEPF